MYYLIVLAFMLVLPVLSIAIDGAVSEAGLSLALLGKWFVFWSVGVRLFTAGVKQIVDPAFTAQSIFETSDRGARVVVQELGFANVAAGLVGILSLWFPEWTKPVAAYALVFYGAAAIKHITNARRNALENVATISDAWISAVMLVFLLGSFLFR